MHAVEVYAKYLRDGRIKIDPAKKIQGPLTYQDPCNLSRSGDLAGYGRYIISHLAHDFRDMAPNREHNHCCGGGAGFVPMGPTFKRRRMESGRVKAEQIRATGAKTIIVPCHNCFDQIQDLNTEYRLGVKVTSFKELITHAMIVPEEFLPEDGHEKSNEKQNA